MKNISIYIIALFLLAGCAKVSTPVGGPRDTTPPKVLKLLPEDQSTNFSERTIKITFDEFFTLNNPTENVLISPPMQQQPEFEIKNKTLVVKIKDTLRANTTYNLLFTDCILDYNESNKLGLLQYSFSTGNAIDSCTISGSISDAKNLNPAEGFFIFLYDKDIDSLPKSAMPTYITKANKDGRFSFRNIAAGSYKVFALKDGNGNYRYDLPTEEIAFLDSMVSVQPAPAKDSSGNYLDTNYKPISILLQSFAIADTTPKLQRYENPAAGVYKFPYRSSILQFSATTDADYFQVINETKDTITWYLKSIPSDTIPCLLTADSHTDTVVLKPYKPKSGGSGGRGGGNRTQSVSKLGATFTNAGHRYQPLTLRFSYPIQARDSFDVYVYKEVQKHYDTLIFKHIVPDTFVTELPLPISFEEKKSYTIMIPDSIFEGYNGLYNDTLRTSFTSKTERDYGNLIINYQFTDSVCPYIVQLYVGNKKIQEDIISQNCRIEYNNLEPGDYSIHAIRDENRNGRWDTGCYERKQQPEIILRFPKNISVRAFWDTEETFTLEASAPQQVVQRSGNRR